MMPKVFRFKNSSFFEPNKKMPELQKTTNRSINSAIAFIDYKPAELRKGKRWIIVYYAKHPITKDLQRQRVIVPKMANQSERTKHASKIILEINDKLRKNWLPFYDDNKTENFKTWEFCFNKFIEHTEFEVKNKEKRPDTLRSYSSFINLIKTYIAENKISAKLILELNKTFFVNYLDWIYLERKNSARTYNNHLNFIITFINYCISRGWLVENFANSIKKKAKQKKKRVILTAEVKKKVKEIQYLDFHYFTLCMMTYYCFVRRTELTKLKVGDLRLHDGYIVLPGESSKNKITDSVTIPRELYTLLVDHLKEVNSDDYLFSADSFKTGRTQLQPKKISDTWEKFRKLLKISSEFQFYSLKDTGITDLLNAGVPAIKVRDQARHHDIKITESYTDRNKTFDEVVQNANFMF